MKTLKTIWRRITSTRTARALEEEILPHMRAQEAEITRLRADITRRAVETERQAAEVAQKDAEIDRLRAENRALLNSILGIAGLPPIVVSTAPGVEGIGLSAPGASAEPALLPGDASLAPSGGNLSRMPNAAQPKSHALAAPTRRRSWPQIHRALEFAAAQKVQVHEDSPGVVLEST